MKNYFSRFGLSIDADVDEVEHALSVRTGDPADALSVTEGLSVLLDPHTRTHYNRLHLQYQAMTAAADCLEQKDARNTHRWLERFVEYPMDDDTLEDL